MRIYFHSQLLEQKRHSATIKAKKSRLFVTLDQNKEKDLKRTKIKKRNLERLDDSKT